MKNMFRMFAFVGIFNLGLVAFAEEKKADAAASEESIQVVCPVSTEENCENCDTTEKITQPTVESAEK